MFLQIFDNAKATKKDRTVSGVYIDIDASFSNKLTEEKDVIQVIDNLHTEQKKLFFALLNPEYILTLNPKY